MATRRGGAVVCDDEATPSVKKGITTRHAIANTNAEGDTCREHRWRRILVANIIVSPDANPRDPWSDQAPGTRDPWKMIDFVPTDFVLFFSTRDFSRQKHNRISYGQTVRACKKYVPSVKGFDDLSISLGVAQNTPH